MQKYKDDFSPLFCFVWIKKKLKKIDGRIIRKFKGETSPYSVSQNT